MSFFRTFDKATSPHSTSITSAPLWYFFCPILNQQQSQKRKHRSTSIQEHVRHILRKESRRRTNFESVENAFFRALSQAGNCHHHTQSNIRPLLACGNGERRPTVPRGATSELGKRRTCSRAIHTTQTKAGQSAEASIEDLAARSIDDWMWEIKALPKNTKPTAESYKRDMKEIGNVYNEWDSRKFPSIASHDITSGPGPPTISIQNEEIKSNLERRPLPVLLERLRELLKARPTQIQAAEAVSLYFELPRPRTEYLEDWQIKKLLRAISWSRRDSVQKPLAWAQQFLSIMDDLKSLDRPIDMRLWNSAISFAAEAVGTLGRQHVEASLALWQQMESQHGITGDIVTFTILFDQASKAGKFVLADMIYQEIINRGLVIDRFTRLARIYYHGRRGDGEAVRFSYARFVDAGEIVTTSALTCVIESLFNAGEPAAAEQVFANMKHHHDTTVGATLPPQNPKEERVLHRIVNKASATWRHDKVNRESIQKAAPIGPDVRTYKTLIRYHAHEEGDFDRSLDLLTEMRERDLNADWPIFMWIFRGFQRHGGIRFSGWTPARLEGIYEQFIAAADARPEDFLQAGTTSDLVRAFVKCSTRKRAQEIFDEWMRRWKPERERSDATSNRIHKMRK